MNTIKEKLTQIITHECQIRNIHPQFINEGIAIAVNMVGNGRPLMSAVLVGVAMAEGAQNKMPKAA